MLSITVAISPEGWDEAKQEFVEPEYTTLELEHSLVSISKWESKYHRSFISSKQEKTAEEILDYIKIMTINKVDPEVYNKLSIENVKQIQAYIDDPMCATYIPESPGSDKNKESVTAELIYYWMISLQIPVEFEHWHLNRLMTLIRVFNLKDNPKKNKTSQRDLINKYAAINAANKKKFNTRG